MPTTLKRRSAIFYGWWMTLAGAILMGYNGGMYFYGFGTFFTPIIQEFGWSRAITAGAFSLSRLEGGLGAAVVGFLVDRLGPRRLLLVGLPCMFGGFLWLSQMHSLWEFYAAFLLTTIGQSLTGAGVVLTAISNWFVRKRGMALGLATAGSGLSGILVPLLAWLIGVEGWRNAALVAGLGFLVIGGPLALFFRHRPEAYGLLPDGVLPHSVSATGFTEAPLSPVQERNFGAMEALRTRAFWLLASGLAVRQLANSALTVHAIPFLISVGFEAPTAGLVITGLTVLSITGRLGFGWLGDRWSKRHLIAGGIGAELAGLLLFAALVSPWQVLPFLLLYAPAYGGVFTLSPAIRGDYFGRKAFGTIQGLMMAVQTLGSIGGPVFAGYVFDVTGSYRPAFFALAGAKVVAILLILAARKPA